MSESLEAVRANTARALTRYLKRHRAGVQVSKVRRISGNAQRTKPLLEIGILSAPEPDRAELTLRLTVGGDVRQAESKLDKVMQQVEDGLPVTVDPPSWEVSYDQDASVWEALATASTFRE